MDRGLTLFVLPVLGTIVGLALLVVGVIQGETGEVTATMAGGGAVLLLSFGLMAASISRLEGEH